MAAWISRAISDSSCLSLHHHLFPRKDQSRLEPALIWEIHTAKAAAGWPRGWHRCHLVMTTTAGAAQARIIVCEDTSVLDRSTFFVCHVLVTSITLDGKLLVIPGLLCKRVPSSQTFALHTFKSCNSFLIISRAILQILFSPPLLSFPPVQILSWSVLQQMLTGLKSGWITGSNRCCYCLHQPRWLPQIKQNADMHVRIYSTLFV